MPGRTPRCTCRMRRRPLRRSSSGLPRRRRSSCLCRGRRRRPRRRPVRTCGWGGMGRVGLRLSFGRCRSSRARVSGSSRASPSSPSPPWWIPAPYRVRGRLSAGMTVGSALSGLGMGSRPVSGTGQALRGNDDSGAGDDPSAGLRAGSSAGLRAGSAEAEPARPSSPSPQPSPVKGEGVREPERASSSRAMCPRSSLAASTLCCGA